jgi:hypothetical protein
MDFQPRTVVWIKCALAGLVWLLPVVAARARSGAYSFESSGARYGFGANNSSNDFHEAEAFTDFSLPWQWKVGHNFYLDSRLDVGAGWLGERGTDAFVGEAGPLFVLTYKQFPVTLAGGSNATGLSRSEFESKDLGIQFQFTTHIGLYWDFARHFRAGYRYQHISNGGLSDHNPGVNLHVFGLSYVF